MPLTRSIRVVFPAPLGPIKAQMLPAGTLKLHPLTAWTPPKE
jgi:hypothetical protein